MKTEEKIERLFNVVDEENETLFVVHVDENNVLHVHGCGDTDNIGAAVATIIHDGMQKNAEEETEKVADAIVRGIGVAMQLSSTTAINVTRKLSDAITKSLEEVKDKILKELSLLEDEDDDENCDECENNRWCPLPDAVKYRKKNHIPAPKKGKKNGKGGGKKNNDAN